MAVAVTVPRETLFVLFIPVLVILRSWHPGIPINIKTFVTSGLALNVAQFGFSAGYVVAMLPQLQQPHSSIPIDDEMGSWLASSYTITIVVGNLFVGSIMAKYGRWKTNILSLTFALAGWVSIVLAESITWILIGRILQGINLGLIQVVAPIMIGECSSPKYRGILLTSLTAIMSLGTLVVHAMSCYLHWRTCGLICTIITFVDLLICLYSPESPSWLANQGRYEDSKKTFRWLRGNNEEEELRRLIEVCIEVNESKIHSNQNDVRRSKDNTLTKLRIMFKKKEAYKPIIISIHLFSLAYWCGLNILAAYPNDIIRGIAGKDVNITAVMISVDLLRFFANFIGLYVIKKIKRKSVLLAGVGLNLVIIFLISGYNYAKSTNNFPFETSYVGIILIHIHMFSIAVGALPLSIIISGEIFPLEYRSLAMGFATTVTAINNFLAVKTFLYFVKRFNIYGSYLIYGIICTYCLILCYINLPETKDRTLQDIEDEFKGRPSRSEEESNKFILKNVNS